MRRSSSPRVRGVSPPGGGQHGRGLRSQGQPASGHKVDERPQQAIRKMGAQGVCQGGAQARAGGDEIQRLPGRGRELALELRHGAEVVAPGPAPVQQPEQPRPRPLRVELRQGGHAQARLGHALLGQQAQALQQQQLPGSGAGVRPARHVLKIIAEDVSLAAKGRGGHKALQLPAHAQQKVALVLLLGKGLHARQKAQRQAGLVRQPQRGHLVHLRAHGGGLALRQALQVQLAHLGPAFAQRHGNPMPRIGVLPRRKVLVQVEHRLAAHLPGGKALRAQLVRQRAPNGHGQAAPARRRGRQGGQDVCAARGGGKGLACRNKSPRQLQNAHQVCLARSSGSGGVGQAERAAALELAAQGGQGAGSVAEAAKGVEFVGGVERAGAVAHPHFLRRIRRRRKTKRGQAALLSGQRQPG